MEASRSTLFFHNVKYNIVICQMCNVVCQGDIAGHLKNFHRKLMDRQAKEELRRKYNRITMQTDPQTFEYPEDGCEPIEGLRPSKVYVCLAGECEFRTENLETIQRHIGRTHQMKANGTRFKQMAGYRFFKCVGRGVARKIVLERENAREEKEGEDEDEDEVEISGGLEIRKMNSRDPEDQQDQVAKFLIEQNENTWDEICAERDEEMQTVDPRNHIGAARWAAVSRWDRYYTGQN
ncbi:uncharacterized protein V1516DRAFT_684563, partial [Lipomyces oligophaga]|uniref:uncharacterized protein n=1 Tax=Lipomyces oligophaga TaxID=45792 RepID=UPI0034CFBE21